MCKVTVEFSDGTVYSGKAKLVNVHVDKESDRLTFGGGKSEWVPGEWRWMMRWEGRGHLTTVFKPVVEEDVNFETLTLLEKLHFDD